MSHSITKTHLEQVLGSNIEEALHTIKIEYCGG